MATASAQTTKAPWQETTASKSYSLNDHSAVLSISIRAVLFKYKLVTARSEVSSQTPTLSCSSNYICIFFDQLSVAEFGEFIDLDWLPPFWDLC